MTAGRTEGFHAGTPLHRARRSLREVVDPLDRTETVAVERADGRVLSTGIRARRNVPHYPRAALDGYAVRAADTREASETAPAILGLARDEVGPGEAVRVHTGSEIPPGATAVVRLERVEPTDRGIAVTRPVPDGKDVAPVGEDVREGQRLFDPGHRLRPSDLGLLVSAGVREVAVAARPRVRVIPTGEEVVEADPGPGETVETNGLAVSRYVARWGGDPRRGGVVADDEEALARAIRDGAADDVVVTIGGSSVGERDLVPGVVESIGELPVHGVSIRPGHPVGIGHVDGTPVLLLPGYPVSCIVTAIQFLRPAVAWLSGTEPGALPSRRATLAEPIESDGGVRRYERVHLRSTRSGDETSCRRAAAEGSPPDLEATPTAHSGAGVLSSVALADGWVEVPEAVRALPTGTEVTVQDWEWHP